MNEDRLILEGQIRECYGRVVYSHKTHEKCADILIRKLENIKLWQIVVSALVTGGIVSTFFDKGNVSAIISVVLSTILLILNTYTKNYDLGELAQ
ncbi:SLATT domain-containing protein, partial [Klebsiella pneumoniae]|uniref:SLATT domain-containing protein n=2 Tax=Klebsiella pneumoniae complex TaxID=3390273 RepID=UPI00111DD777